MFMASRILRESEGGVETNVNTSLFKDSLKNLGDPTVVREHNKFLSAEARGA